MPNYFFLVTTFYPGNLSKISNFSNANLCSYLILLKSVYLGRLDFN